MRNVQEVGPEPANRLLGELPGAEQAAWPNKEASVTLAKDDAEIPFTPIGQDRVPGDEQTPPFLAMLANFRWRRTLLVFLAIAIASSVALAAGRGPSFNGEGRATGVISGDRLLEPGVGETVTGDDEATVAAASDPNVESEVLSESASPPSGDQGGASAQALEVTATSMPSTTSLRPVRSSSSPTIGSEAVKAGSGEGNNAGVAPTSPSTPTTAATIPETLTETVATTPSTTAPRSTTQRPSTTERTETTQVATTAEQTTTTQRQTTTQRTTTTLVLVGRSAGGFESPTIGDDMVWLENGDVGRWRSTNDDIQLMQSGFEDIQSVDGGQFAELNSSSQAGLYRSLTVEPGTVIEWELLHRARSGTETMQIQIGPPNNLEVVDTINNSTRWASFSGRWTVPDGVTKVRFMMWSNKSGAYGNLVDDVRVVSID